jgi:hypothetical protein
MLSLLTAAVNAEAEARNTRLEKLGFESMGRTTSYDSASEDAMDPVSELFNALQARFPILQGVYRYYSSLNSRNPFSMSVHSWLALCKDAGLDKLVSSEKEGTSKKAKLLKRKPSSASAGQSPPTSPKIASNSFMEGSLGGLGGLNGSVLGSNTVSGTMGAHEGDDEEHVDNSSKMALEVIFFTATSSGSGEDKVENASAIDLNYSKHDMRRHEFILALMALARYRQRRIVRQPKEKKDKVFLNSLFLKESREIFAPMSFSEFLDILDVDLIGRLEKGNLCDSDSFREDMLYHESVANLFTSYETTIKFNYNSYKLSPMGCGRKYTQLPLSAYIRMMKDCGVLGELVN